MKIYSLVFHTIFILSCISTNAQWIKTNGPEGGEISALATDGNRIFAGTQGSGIYYQLIKVIHGRQLITDYQD